jgi:hypothetical protein
LNYSCQKRPPVPVTPLDPLNKEIFRESIKELTAIISTEWVEEAKLSCEEIQIYIPSSIIQCQISRTMTNILYNPIVGVNLMSASFASTYLGDEPLTPTNKTFRIAPRSRFKGLGILHNISLCHNNVEVILDFHVFDIQDFNILIGHPLEKLFIETPSSGDLDVKLGRDTFSIPITRDKTSVAATLPYHELRKEVMLVSSFESPKSSLEKDAKLFIEERMT